MRHSITLFKEKMLLLSEPAPCAKSRVSAVCAAGTLLLGCVIRSWGNPINLWH